MGKGSGTGQVDVRKAKIKHTVGDGEGASFGGDTSDGESSANACLFALELKIKYASDGGARFRSGDRVTLALVGPSEIGVFINNRRFSTYGGGQKDRLTECMAKGYVYSGKVQSVGANTLRAVVQGGVLGYAAA